MGYAEFWWAIFLKSFDASKGLFEMIGFLVALFIGFGGLSVAKKRWPRFSERLSDIPGFKDETRRNAILFGLLLIGYVVLVGPYSMHKESDQSLATTNAALAKVKTSMETLEAKNSALEDKLANATRSNSEETQRKLAEEIKEENRRFQKTLIDVAASPDPKQAALIVAAEPRPLPSGLLSGGKLNLDAARASLANKESEMTASQALAHKSANEFNSKVIPSLDSTITNFIAAFQDIASKHGDTALSAYISPPPLLNDTVNSDVKMTKNSNWSFRISVRHHENKILTFNVLSLNADGSMKMRAICSINPISGRATCTLNLLGSQTMRESVSGEECAQKMADYLALLLAKQIEGEPLKHFDAK